MKSRLENHLGQMKMQTMTMNSNGIELSLSIPDNASVKETLQMFIATMVEQQDQIINLEAAMKQMSSENSEAQKNIVSWTTNLVSEVQMSLLGKVNDLNSRLHNFSYNVQGFPARDTTGQQSGALDVISTVPPEILQSPGAIEDVHVTRDLPLTAKEGNVENTSTGTERKQRAPELANSALRTVTSESRPSLREDLQASNGPVIGRTMSMSPQARWRWAIRRVITNTRRDKNQVALSRFRGQRGTSISERLKRLEDGLFSLPIGIQEEVRKEAEDAAQRAQRDTETLDLKLEKLQMQLTAQQEKAQTLSASVANSIFEVKADCSNLDRTCADLDRAVSKLAAIRGKLSQKARQPSQELKPPVDKAASITAVVPDMPEKVTEQPADSSSVAPLLPEAVDKIPPLTAVAQDGGGETLALDLEVVLAGPGPGAAATEAEGVPTPFTDNLEVEEEELGAADAGNAFSSEDAERIERDLESLNRRMNSTEKFHAQSLRGKLQNLQTEVSALQDAATVGVRRLQRLKDESLQAADSSVDALSAGEDVSSLLQLDEDLKEARHTLRSLELRAVALKDWQRGLRAEIALSAAQANTPGGYDSPRTFPSEDVKRDMLKVSDDLLVRIEDIASSLRGHDGAVMPFSSTLTQQLLSLIQEMNNTQLQNQSHSQQPAEPSSTLSPSTGTPQIISAPTPISAALNTAALAKIKKDILAKPSVEDVRVISREGIEGAMAAALEPLRSAIESLSQEVQGLKESMGDIRATAESDRQEVRLLGKEIERMDGEGEKEREIRIARQNQQDAEQKERNIDQKSLHTEFDRNRNENESRRRRDDEDSRRRRDEEESRRRRDEEASKSATPQRVEAIQKKFIPVYLPPGVVACERNQIEISSSDERNSTAARGVHSVSPTSASQSYNVDVIAVGANVNITSGSHSGKQGSVVDVHRATQGNDPSSSVDGAAQYLVKLEESPESNTPLTDRVVTVTPTSHPILHKRRDSEERAAPRIQIEILKMRDEIQQMEITLNSLSRDKINAYQVQQMIDLKTSSMGNAHDKVDTESFLSVEAVVRNLASELDDLRHMQSHRLTTLKKQFDESVKSMNMNQAVSVEQQDQGNFSSVITTGQCLGCGRLSAIHSNSTASTGPETFRAGFRMPLVPAPFRALAVPPGAIGGSEVESVASSVPISAVLVSKSVDLSGNQHTTLESMNLTLDTNSPHYCPTRPRTSSGVFNASQRTIAKAPPAAGLGPVSNGVMVKLGKQGRGSDQGSGSSRLLQRTGFSGVKSIRTESNTPDRYESPSGFVLPHYKVSAPSPYPDGSVSSMGGAGASFKGSTVPGPWKAGDENP